MLQTQELIDLPRQAYQEVRVAVRYIHSIQPYSTASPWSLNMVTGEIFLSRFTMESQTMDVESNFQKFLHSIL